MPKQKLSRKLSLNFHRDPHEPELSPAWQSHLSSSSFVKHIRHIIDGFVWIDGFARADGSDSVDDAFSISLVFSKLVETGTAVEDENLIRTKLKSFTMH